MAITRLHAAALAVGDGVLLDVRHLEEIGLQVAIQTTATVTFRGTIDGTTWADAEALPVGGGAAVTSATASGHFRMNVAAFEQVKAEITSWVAGTVDVFATRKS